MPQKAVPLPISRTSTEPSKLRHRQIKLATSVELGHSAHPVSSTPPSSPMPSSRLPCFARSSATRGTTKLPTRYVRSVFPSARSTSGAWVGKKFAAWTSCAMVCFLLGRGPSGRAEPRRVAAGFLFNVLKFRSALQQSDVCRRSARGESDVCSARGQSESGGRRILANFAVRKSRAKRCVQPKRGKARQKTEH